jgi:hypothetical protein
MLVGEDDMVGKPNLPPDADERDDLHGASRGTPGLSALDEEREASMADEGGASGMTAESQEPGVEVEEYEDAGLGFDALVVGGIFVAGTVAGLLLAGLFNRR